MLDARLGSRSSRALHIVLAALALSLVACGSGASTPGPLETGLPSDKRLSALDDTERQQLCDDVAAYMEREYEPAAQVRDACTLSAVLSSADRASCITARDNCIARAMPGTSTSECTAGEAPGCDATVEDVEICVPESLGLLREAYSRLSCDMAGDPNALRDAQPSREPSERCRQLGERCGGDVPMM